MSDLNQITSKSLVQSIATDNLGDLLGNVAETAIDALLDEGIVRDVPIIGTITGLLKAGWDIRNRLFLKKIAIFLSKISDASAEERKKFAARFENDEDCRRFGEAVLLLLERAEDMEKPRIIGRIMRVAVEGHIDLARAMRLSAIVDRCYLQDLDHLPKFEEGPKVAERKTVVEALQSVGLLSTAGFDGGDFSQKPLKSGTIYVMNEYGEMLLKYGLSDDA